MKTIKQIKQKIADLTEEIEELHKDRNFKKNKNGGVSEEENQDFFNDLHHKSCEITTLKWVISRDNV